MSVSGQARIRAITKVVGQAQGLARSLQFASQGTPHGDDYRFVRCGIFQPK